MIRSMTGFGRCQKTVAGMDITVELKSVNHRYYEYSSRLQRAYGFLDDKLKSYLQGSISRGKVDVPVWYWQGHVIWGMTARIVRDLAQTAP